MTILKDIAFKTKLSNIMLILGAILFAIISLLSVIIKPNGWIVFLILSVLMVIIFFWGACYECKRPNCLIKLSDDYLLIYAKGKWNKIQLTDLVAVNYRKIKSGRMVLSSGTLKIITKDSSYNLSNVKNVEDVALILQKIK